MGKYGLQQGKDGLQVYMMVEIPSNVTLIDQFCEVFDGFSIGSNDLTQLTLGLDRWVVPCSGGLVTQPQVTGIPTGLSSAFRA